MPTPVHLSLWIDLVVEAVVNDVPGEPKGLHRNPLSVGTSRRVSFEVHPLVTPIPLSNEPSRVVTE
jgi:hypothetical protein